MKHVNHVPGLKCKPCSACTESKGVSPSPQPSPARGEGAGHDGRWRSCEYKDLVARDKASLDIFWLEDESLSESDNLPDPDVIAREIVDDLEAALEQFREIANDLVIEEPDNG